MLGADDTKIWSWSFYGARADNRNYLFSGQLLCFRRVASYPVDSMLSTLDEEINNLATEVAGSTEDVNFGHLEQRCPITLILGFQEVDGLNEVGEVR